MSGPESLPESVVANLSSEQHGLLERYIGLLLSATAEFNLTAIRERDEAWNRHVIESLRLLPLLEAGRTMIDIGSGGGLPGLVVAIARPDLKVTLLEATTKKALFLERAAKELNLHNVTVLAQRAEDASRVGSLQREAFDLATARAVAPLRVLLELTIPFLKPSGRFVAVKGERAQEELREAQRALEILHVSLESEQRHPTATVLVLRKNRSTSEKYPRRAGEPKRRPL